MRIAFSLLFITALLTAATAATAEETASYSDCVETCVDTLMEHGRDVYGPKQTPVLVSILDIETLTCPEDPGEFDEPWRVIRRHRRNPAGADLATDMPLLSVMRGMGGAPKKFAREYAAYYLANMRDRKTDLICWGWHEYYDVFTDTCHFDQHEIHGGVDQIDWGLLWKADADATRREIVSIWKWHVIDKESGEINRHGDGKPGCDFSMTAGAFIDAFVFMHAKTKDPVWLDRAKLLAQYYWDRRNPDTNLVPERPNAGTERFDGGHFVTSTAGPLCGSLLEAYEQSKDRLFLDHALAYLRAYGQYGFDAEKEAYWGSLHLDGRPNDLPTEPEGYAKYEPRGHLDLWEPYPLGYQYALLTGMSYAKAYDLTKDEGMLTHARRFADWVLEERPGVGGIRQDTWYGEYARTMASEGTYAGKYGRAISFLLMMHRATGESRYVEGAREYADEAIAKLYHNGLLRGHAAKPYYEAVDGVGFLLQALVELDAG